MFNVKFAAVTNTGSWTETLEIKASDDGALIDMTPYTVAVTLRGQGDDSALLTADVTKPATGYVQFRFPSLTSLDEGFYEVGMTVSDGTDKDSFAIGVLPVLQGF